jgi:hypothetical protein
MDEREAIGFFAWFEVESTLATTDGINTDEIDEHGVEGIWLPDCGELTPAAITSPDSWGSSQNPIG